MKCRDPEYRKKGTLELWSKVRSVQGKGRAQAGRKGCVGTWVMGEGCLCTITVWLEEKIQTRTMRNKVRRSAELGTHSGRGAG